MHWPRVATATDRKHDNVGGVERGTASSSDVGAASGTHQITSYCASPETNEANVVVLSPYFFHGRTL